MFSWMLMVLWHEWISEDSFKIPPLVLDNHQRKSDKKTGDVRWSGPDQPCIL
jgi:hypothetical protein